MSLQGSLTIVSLPDILQILAMNRATGALELERTPEHTGKLLLTHGELVDARTSSGHAGEEAFSRLMAWNRGAFRFVEARVNGTRSIDKPLDALILTCLTQQDELVHALEPVGPMNGTVRFTPPDDIAALDLSEEEWQLLPALESAVSVEELLDHSPLPRRQTCELLLEWKRKNLIEVKATATVSSSAAADHEADDKVLKWKAS